ncbi:MAG: hypothetical protein WC755_05880, partial [Candidatus Woesearchaeota archaeon]
MKKQLLIGQILAKGKHGIVYDCKFGSMNCVIKKENEKSDSNSTMLKEATFLKKLNIHKIGPKLYYSDNNSVVMEKLNGDIIQNFDLKEKKNKYIAISVLKQCFIMDKLGINKFEMTNPYKHIFVSGKKVTMIDFERCIYTTKPKNVTQFCEYLRRRGFEIDKDVLIEYKNSIS